MQQPGQRDPDPPFSGFPSALLGQSRDVPKATERSNLPVPVPMPNIFCDLNVCMCVKMLNVHQPPTVFLMFFQVCHWGHLVFSFLHCENITMESRSAVGITPHSTLPYSTSNIIVFPRFWVRTTYSLGMEAFHPKDQKMAAKLQPTLEKVPFFKTRLLRLLQHCLLGIDLHTGVGLDWWSLTAAALWAAVKSQKRTRSVHTSFRGKAHHTLLSPFLSHPLWLCVWE